MFRTFRSKANKNNFNQMVIKDNYIFYLKNESIISDKLIAVSITNFLNVIVDNPDLFEKEKHHLFAPFRIKSSDNVVKTLGTLRVVNLDDNGRNYLIRYVQNVLALKLDGYDDFPINQIIVSYIIKQGTITPNYSLLSDELESLSLLTNYKNYKLPGTMDVTKYGKILDYTESENKYVIHVTDLTTFKVYVEEGKNRVEVFRKGEPVLSYVDEKKSDDLFIRTIGNDKLYYSNDGELLLRTSPKRTQYFFSKEVESKLLKKI